MNARREGDTHPAVVEALAHPLVVDARAEGAHVFTAWRLAYNLPPNDPRYLEATEEEILRDLLVRRYHDEHVDRVLHPERTAIEDLAADPDAPARMEARKLAAMRDPVMQARLQAIGIGGRSETKAPATPARINLRTRGTSGPPKEPTAP